MKKEEKGTEKIYKKEGEIIPNRKIQNFFIVTQTANQFRKPTKLIIILRIKNVKRII